MPNNTGRSWFRYFQYEEGKDSPGDARNVILVVITLIAAVTFQAGVNPPGGVWQDTHKGVDGADAHVAGSAIYASQHGPYYAFLFSNTVALSTSVLVIMSLTYRFPFYLELWIANVAMLFTYGSAVFAVTPADKYNFRYVLFVGALPFVVRVLIQLYNRFINPKVPNFMNEIEN